MIIDPHFIAQLTLNNSKRTQATDCTLDFSPSRTETIRSANDMPHIDSIFIVFEPPSSSKLNLDYCKMFKNDPLENEFYIKFTVNLKLESVVDWASTVSKSAWVP